MANIALLIEYDGSRFFGFQRQKTEVRTIQTELESALSKFANHEITIIPAGRTDTGVHAFYQVINFMSDAKRKLYGWVCGVNALLPNDIRVHEASVVLDNFNARFDAIARSYKYYLLEDRVGSALLKGRVGVYHANLDVEKMQQAGKLLIGRHDFSSFRASDCQANTPVRELTHFSLARHNNLLCFEFTANAFLYHMIRNIMGALIFVGTHKLSVTEFNNIFKACDRTIAPPTFMPDGLYLSNVTYKQHYFTYKPNFADFL